MDTSSRSSTTADAAADRLGDPALAEQPLAPARRRGPGPRARPGRPRSRESARPCSARARSSAVRRASRASISACRAARAASASRSRSAVSGSSSGASSAAASRASSSASPARSPVAGLLGRGDRRGRAARPRRVADAGRRAELAELLGDGGQGGVGLVQPGQRDVDPVLGLGPLAPRAGTGRSRAARRRAVASGSCSVASSTAACTSIRLGWRDEPPEAKCAPSRSPSRVTAVTSASVGDQRRGRRRGRRRRRP